MEAPPGSEFIACKTDRIFTVFFVCGFLGLCLFTKPSIVTPYKSIMHNVTYRTFMPKSIKAQFHDEVLQVPACDMKQRLMNVRHMCSSLQKGGKMPSVRMIVDHGRKIAYCDIPKTGVTTWKMVMANNTLNGPRIPADQDPKFWIHSRINKFGLKQVRYSHVLENYTKFMVVRHPFDRLLSAFYDKAFPQYIQNGRKILTQPSKGISSYVLRKFHQNDTEVEKKNYNATFWEFVQYSLEKQDIHWNPIFNKCGPCFINYDFILRTETLQRDSELILSEIYPELTSLPAYNAMRKTSAAKNVRIVKYLKEFKKLEANLISVLLHKYGQDFQQFGYQYDVTSHIASCAFRNENGEDCC